MKLHQAARSCRQMAVECVTEDAREALLEVADSLGGEAIAKEEITLRRFRGVVNPRPRPTRIHVSPKHISKYLGEFKYR